MKLTRERKIYATIFGLALAGLTMDRLFLGGSPDAALAADAGLLISADPQSSGTPAAARAAPLARVQSGPEAITRMLDSMRAQRDVPLESVHNAFAASWVKVPESVRARAARPTQSGPDVRQFMQHKLTAVMGNGRNRAAAMIDGKMLQLGQTLDGFKLISVDTQSALFEQHGVQVRLALAAPRDDAGQIIGRRWARKRKHSEAAQVVRGGRRLELQIV